MTRPPPCQQRKRDINKLKRRRNVLLDIVNFWSQLAGESRSPFAGMWSSGFGVRGSEFGVRSLEVGVRGLGVGVWEFGVWSSEFGVWSSGFGVWSSEFAWRCGLHDM